MIKAVISIAGSDSSGAAGLQADLRTFQQLGIHGASVISAVTAQTQADTVAIHPISQDLFQQQFQHLLSDFEVAAIKTGMLASAAQVEFIASYTPENIPLIIDPVLCSSSGHKLICTDTLNAMQQLLFSKARLITPNIPELQQLTNTQQSLEKTKDLIECAERLTHRYDTSVLLKGGHSSNQLLTDYLFEKNHNNQIETTIFQHDRQPGEYRGTGCILSAAIAAYLASKPEINLQSACQLGIEYLQHCINHTPSTLLGRPAILRHSGISKYN